jgi:hypothetical protein
MRGWDRDIFIVVLTNKRNKKDEIELHVDESALVVAVSVSSATEELTAPPTKRTPPCYTDGIATQATDYLFTAGTFIVSLPFKCCFCGRIESPDAARATIHLKIHACRCLSLPTVVCTGIVPTWFSFSERWLGKTP